MKYNDRLLNIALNLFEWEGLPETIDQRVMEDNLIKHGKVMFVNDSKFGLLCLPVNATADRNIYNQPLKYNVVGYGYNETFSKDDGVVIFNNLTGSNSINVIDYYASKLDEIDATQDVNLLVQKTPYFISGTREQITSLKTGVKQVLNNKVVVAVSKDFNTGDLNVLQLNPPYLLDKLQDHKNNILGEFLTYVGIDNNIVDKRERAVVSEVEANDEMIHVNGDVMLVVRERAAKKINEMFGLNITVKRKMDINTFNDNDYNESGDDYDDE